MDEDLSWLQKHVDNLKGNMSFIYDYHSSSWSGFRECKREVLATTVRIEDGEGQDSLAECIKELRKILEETK